MLPFVGTEKRIDFKIPSTNILLFSSLVHSSLEHCCQVWTAQYEIHIIRIERVQRRYRYVELSHQTRKAKELFSYEEHPS